MAANKQQVLEQALQLSEEDRHEVISRLAESLGWEEDEIVGWTEAWLAECDRRLDRMERGEDAPIPVDQVLPSWRPPQ